MARTWLQDWQPERAQWLVPPLAVAPVPLGSPGVVAKQAPLLRVLQVLRLPVALLEPQQGARNPAPQALPNWRVGAFLAAWHRAQARP